MTKMTFKLAKATQILLLASGCVVSLASATTVDKTEAHNKMKTMQDEREIKQTAIERALGRQPNQAEAELLLSAIKTGKFELVEKLVEAGIDIDAPSIGDGTALMMAVSLGDVSMVQSLLNIGANPNAISEGDGNALIVAAKMNRPEVASVLLSSGANIDAEVEGDETALITACRFDNFDMVKLLVEKGANVNLAVKTSDGEVRSPLNQAYSEQVKTFLAQSGAKL